MVNVLVPQGGGVAGSGMAPSRPYDGCHGAGDGPPPQRPAGGGAERGRGPRDARRPTGTEATSRGDAAGSPAGARAAGEGSYGRLRGCPGALADTAAEAVDARTVKFLLSNALKQLKEGRRMEAEEGERWMAQVKAMNVLSRRLPRKRKKKRKRKLPRSSSHSSLGRARRRLRQWHARCAGLLGDVPFPAVFPSVVVRLAMVGIMAGMDEKDSGALIVDSGSVMCKARFAGYDTPRVVFPFGCRQAQDALHLGPYGPDYGPDC